MTRIVNHVLHLAACHLLGIFLLGDSCTKFRSGCHRCVMGLSWSWFSFSFFVVVGTLVEAVCIQRRVRPPFFVWLCATRNAAIRGPVTGSCTEGISIKVTCSRQIFIQCINSRRLMTSYVHCRLGINKYFHYFAGGGGGGHGSSHSSLKRDIL
jgi:hypothetical protein